MTFAVKMTKEEIIDGLKSTYGTEFNAADVRGFAAANDLAYATVTKKLKEFRVKPGKWNLEVTTKDVETIEKSFNAPAVEPTLQQNLVPDVDQTFVKFGSFNDVKNILKSKQFYPTFITGLSGNGKTFGVEQACAQLGRELIRVNITIETMKTILLVGFALLMGQQFGITDLSLKHSKGVQSCYSTKLTWLQTKSSVSNPSLKGKVCF